MFQAPEILGQRSHRGQNPAHVSDYHLTIF